MTNPHPRGGVVPVREMLADCRARLMHSLTQDPENFDGRERLWVQHEQLLTLRSRGIEIL